MKYKYYAIKKCHSPASKYSGAELATGNEKITLNTSNAHHISRVPLVLSSTFLVSVSLPVKVGEPEEVLPVVEMQIRPNLPRKKER